MEMECLLSKFSVDDVFDSIVWRRLLSPHLCMVLSKRGRTSHERSPLTLISMKIIERYISFLSYRSPCLLFCGEISPLLEIPFILSSHLNCLTMILCFRLNNVLNRWLEVSRSEESKTCTTCMTILFFTSFLTLSTFGVIFSHQVCYSRQSNLNFIQK